MIRASLFDVELGHCATGRYSNEMSRNAQCGKDCVLSQLAILCDGMDLL